MSPRVADCPTAEELDRFLAGKLEATRIEAVSAHLDRCAGCRKRVEASGEHQALADDVRWAGKEFAGSQVDVGVPAARLNELLSDYEVMAEIGRGGMGVVYRARQRSLNRIVALKVLPALVGAVRPEAMTRFRREAELAARLKHSNIIAVYDFGEVEGTLYYAMEYVEGRSLRDVLREIEETGASDAVMGSPSGSAGSSERRSDTAASSVGSGKQRSSAATSRTYFEQAARWMADVAEALDYAHRQSVVHRDVKPSNLLLSADGRIMISDFGLARAAGMESLTIDRGVVGTVRYMSPEQVDEERGPVDGRTDVYSAGATLYELLALRPPFAGKDDGEVWHAILHNDPPPPHRTMRRVPGELETICLKALEKDRNARYATAKDFADDLRRWLLGVPIMARRPSPIVRFGKFVNRRKLPVALAAACAVLLIGGGAIFAAYRTSQREADSARTTARAQSLELALRNAEDKRDNGQFEEALREIDSALTLHPDSPELMRLKARTLVPLGRTNEALRTLNQLLAHRPDDWRAHYQAAYWLADQRWMSMKYAGCSPVVKFDLPAEERRRLYRLHHDELARLQPDSAEMYCLQAQDESDPARAIVLLNRSLDSTARLIEALVCRANCWDQLSDYEAMLRDADALVMLRRGWAPVHDLRGAALYALGRYSDSEQAYSEAIELDPQNANSWLNRSLAKSSRGRFDAALSDANESLRLAPETPNGWAARSRARCGMGQLDDALRDINRAISLDPSGAEMFLERAKLQVDRRHPEDAVADCTRVIELRPNDPRGYLNRGVAFTELKKPDRAIEDFTDGLRLAPGNPQVYRSRGVLYAKSRKFDLALSDFSKAMELAPGFFADYQNRAEVYLLTGRYSDAIADLTQLTTLKPDGLGVVLMTRGMAYELSGARSLAAADYSKAEEMDGPVGDYAVLWKYIMTRLDGQKTADAAALTAPDSGSQSPSSWCRRLYAFLAGGLTPAELLAAAATDAERCEAHYYIGAKALIDGRTDEARKEFEACLKLKRTGVMEADFARARLAQLESKKSS